MSQFNSQEEFTTDAANVDEMGALMDPAQQSLADALRITFRVLQVVMALLVALFLGSGFQTIEESERGIKLVFGRVVQDDIPPGVTWNWPFPIGEMVKVRTGEQRTFINDKFGPQLTQEDRMRPIARVVGRAFQLNPSEVGSVITADSAIAHTWWNVIWRRDQPALNTRNVHQPDEERIVRAAVHRGVVRALAEIEIDDLLKQRTTDEVVTGESSLDARVRRIAQETLDAFGAGVRIERVSLVEKSPPGQTLNAFQQVTTAENRAATRREQAEQASREVLNSVAGEAHSVLLDLIDDYERAIELADDAEAERILATIDRMIDGEIVEINGVSYSVRGQVTSVINRARQYRTNIVSNIRSRVATYETKFPLYSENPELFVAREWRPAYEAFLTGGLVEIQLVSPEADVEIWLNRDPEIYRERERAEHGREAREAFEEMDERRERAFRDQQRRERLQGRPNQ
ncbi:MAG: hypothetical protein EA376_02955 [Phycisphaeraceae bacterium]|nr:MAG: hypothetical protein EA376_02955 [Phycisphaeraceae bacterium]